MMRKTKILTWLVILLVVLNLATIGSLMYHQQWEKNQNSVISAGGASPSGLTRLNGRFFRQELGFTPGQMDRFREINQSFRPQTMQILYEMDSLKEAMFNAMCEAEADTQRIIQFATAIGERHSQLKETTYRLFSGLRAICTGDQASKLQDVFRPLFLNENLPANPGGGFRKGPAWQTD